MTRVELLENMRTVIGLYVVDVLHHGDDPFKEVVRFSLFTLNPGAPTILYAHNTRRVDARLFNMGETELWLASTAGDAATKTGLPLTPVPKEPDPVEYLDGSVRGYERRPCGGYLTLAPPGTVPAMYACAHEGGHLLVLERIQP